MLFLAAISTLIAGIIVGILIERNNAARIEALLNSALAKSNELKADAAKVAVVVDAVKNDINKL